MKLFLFILFSLLATSLFSQKIIEFNGYLTEMRINDSVIKMREYHSTESFDNKGWNHSESRYALDSTGINKDYYSFYYKLNNSNNSISGWIRNGDTSYTQYIHDTLNNRYYILYEKDTEMVFETKYENKKLIYEHQINCKPEDAYTRFYYYNKNGLVDSVYYDSQYKYANYDHKTYLKYDSKGRCIYQYEFRLDSNQVSMEMWWEYDDDKKTRKDIYSKFEDYGDWGEEEVIYFDENYYPFKKVYYRFEKNRTSIYTIEYEKVK